MINRVILSVLVVLATLLLCAELRADNKDNNSKKPQLKKITVIESDNVYPDQRYTTLSLPKTLSTPALKQLREHVNKEINTKNYSDPAVFFTLMEWVCLQWKHHAINQPPVGTSSYQILVNAKHGAEYRCQEYAQVLNDILISYGYISRIVQLFQPGASYGAPGSGHVGVEVWSNTLVKWIYLDPQWCMQISYEGKVFSFYELSEQLKNGNLAKLQFTTSEKVLQRDQQSAETYINSYAEFIQKYIGQVAAVLNINSHLDFVCLLLGTHQQELTFQGVPINGRIFTDNYKNLYFQINRTTIIFDYSYEVNWPDIFQKYKIQSPDEYVEKMPFFAAKPTYSLRFQNNMWWFKYYEVKTDPEGSWKKVNGDKYDWSLTEGINTIQVRSVNQEGIPGSVTTVKILYGDAPSPSTTR